MGWIKAPDEFEIDNPGWGIPKSKSVFAPEHVFVLSSNAGPFPSGGDPVTHPHIPIQPVVIRSLPRVWGEEVIVAETPSYLGKVLYYEKGTAGGLQYHVEKDETFYLLQGRAAVDYDNGQGALVRVEMVPGEAYHIPPGAVHRFEAIEDCVVFEASTPHYDDRVRMEEAYGVPVIGDAYGLPTTKA